MTGRESYDDQVHLSEEDANIEPAQSLAENPYKDDVAQEDEL